MLADGDDDDDDDDCYDDLNTEFGKILFSGAEFELELTIIHM
jgi:hypothetical protein